MTWQFSRISTEKCRISGVAESRTWNRLFASATDGRKPSQREYATVASNSSWSWQMRSLRSGVRQKNWQISPDLRNEGKSKEAMIWPSSESSAGPKFEFMDRLFPRFGAARNACTSARARHGGDSETIETIAT